MDFFELLNIAANNKAAAESKAAVKRYSTTLSAPKKCPKSEVRSEAVQKFLARKKQEEEQSALEEQRKKEELLSLRSQNTKTGKKAKMMASRTKDNNFSQINETGDKVQAKTNTDGESSRTQLSGNTEQMNEKAPFQPSPMNYEDLLQIASQKQHEPLKLTAVKVVNAGNRPMTKKQKDALQEVQARVQRRLERENVTSTQTDTTKINASCVRAAQKGLQDQQTHGKKNRNQVPSQALEKGFILPKNSGSKKHSSHTTKTETSVPPRSLSGVPNARESPENKSFLSTVKNSGSEKPQNRIPQGKNMSRIFPQNCKVRNERQSFSSFARAQVGTQNCANKMLGEGRSILPKSKPVNTVSRVTGSDDTKKSTGMTPKGRIIPGKVGPNNRIPSVKSEVMKRPTMPPVKTSGSNESKRSESKPFHMNPYMDEPLQMLQSQNSRKKQGKRRLESDDDEDDDMSDFIDDEPCDGEIDYSKYIKEIFRCDRKKFADYDDDDDIMETSYSEQMKEEKRSAKLGYLEDLEDIMKEKEEKKRKIMKKKRM